MPQPFSDPTTNPVPSAVASTENEPPVRFYAGILQILTALRRQLRAPSLAVAVIGVLVLVALTLQASLPKLEAPKLTLLGGAVLLGSCFLVLGRAAVTCALPGQLVARTARRTIIVGASRQVARLTETLSRKGVQDMRVVGLLSPPFPDFEITQSAIPQLSDMQDVLRMIEQGEADQIVVAAPWASPDQISPLLQRVTDYAIDIQVANELLDHQLGAYSASDLAGSQLLSLAKRPITGWRLIVKSAEDYILAFLFLLAAAIPMALIAISVRLDSPGPILFRQRRTGLNNRDFQILKFRTMHHHYADHDVRRQVTIGDPRVTRVGAILRRTSLDELPQVFNVLRGEMSFVGPRPHAPGTLAGGRRFEEIAVRYAARHRMKPGITGLAQVRGWRGPTDTEEQLIRRLESDLEYIEAWSIWMDLIIITRTCLVVARMRNAV